LSLRRVLREASALSSSFENAAEFALEGGQPETATRLLGAAEAVRQQAGIVVEAFNVGEHEALLARTREALSEAVFTAAWREGEQLALEEAFTEADTVLAQAAQVAREGERLP
jgi:hypothetical protein